MGQEWWWRSAPVAPGPAVVFDMDGVISDASGRQHLLSRPHRDWDAFFEACGQDDPVDEIARLLTLLEDRLSIVLLTARPVDVRPQTLAWLERHELRWDLLVMRQGGDYTASRRFKKAALEDLRTRGFQIQLAFEDDRRNVEMFHSAGVPCVYIHSGYYD